MNNKNLWFFIFLIFLILMFFEALKLYLGLTLRLAQILIVIIFGTIIINDMIKKTLNLPLLLFLFGSGLLLSLISLNSVYLKVGEHKFIIKYLTTFPAAFYIGYKFVQLVKLKELLKIFELTILVHCLLALLFVFYPISFLMHDRGVLTGYQGTFWESTGFGTVIGLLILLSLSLRYEFNIYPKNIIIYLGFIVFALGSVVASKSKTFWTAIFPIFIYIVFFKIAFYLLRYRAIGSGIFILFEKIRIPNILKIRTSLVLFLVIFITILFTIINVSMEKPIITEEMIKEKIEHERGKALTVTLDLLEKTNWLGGYGWGFVEAYFSTHNIGAIGLGSGVGMIFNSYLNEWLSVGILGLIFHLTLLFLAFSNRHLFTVVAPLYLFIAASVHPIAGGEAYYLFLGLSYGFKKYYGK